MLELLRSLETTEDRRETINAYHNEPVCRCVGVEWPGGLATVHHLHECMIAVRSLDGFTFRMEDH